MPVLRRSLILTLLLLAACCCARAAVVVRISNLNRLPKPPNPVRVFGVVTKLSPVTLSDGSGTVALSGITPELGQFWTVEGNWNGSVIAATSSLLHRRVYPTVLTLGNSITYSPAGSASGWTGNWGMEASAQDKDYVHLILSRLRAADPANAASHYQSWGAHQASGKLSDLQANVQIFKSYHADLITIQIGENDINTSAFTTFKQDYARLLDDLLANHPKPRIFCFGVWQSYKMCPTCYQYYDPPSKEYYFDLWMKEVCDARGIPFRSLRYVAQNPANHNPGAGFVHWHPNDAGMLGYADLFWSAIGPEVMAP